MIPINSKWYGILGIAIISAINMASFSISIAFISIVLPVLLWLTVYFTFGKSCKFELFMTMTLNLLLVDIALNIMWTKYNIRDVKVMLVIYIGIMVISMCFFLFLLTRLYTRWIKDLTVEKGIDFKLPLYSIVNRASNLVCVTSLLTLTITSISMALLRNKLYNRFFLENIIVIVVCYLSMSIFIKYTSDAKYKESDELKLENA